MPDGTAEQDRALAQTGGRQARLASVVLRPLDDRLGLGRNLHQSDHQRRRGPWVIFNNGYYYFTDTTGLGVDVRQATRLAGTNGIGSVSLR